jgi:hypothetical protein
VYNPLAKTLEDLRSNLTREIENILAQILKDTFLNFRKRCELSISAGDNKWHSFLSSLKWYITCKMVTGGYFFIDVLKM